MELNPFHILNLISYNLVEKSDAVHAGDVRSCRKYCGWRCCTEEEIRNVEHNSKIIENAKKSEAVTEGNNKAPNPNHHGGGGHGCYKYCGHHCCTKEEIRNLERNLKVMADARKPNSEVLN